mmetsp:Transcript_14109/g.23444  ORF Transcript_14109/g.23444 Transcript_14109/m.23444 type:complete len:216 (-) Transcript_14109:574-1221(-)
MKSMRWTSALSQRVVRRRHTSARVLESMLARESAPSPVGSKVWSDGTFAGKIVQCMSRSGKSSRTIFSQWLRSTSQRLSNAGRGSRSQARTRQRIPSQPLTESVRALLQGTRVPRLIGSPRANFFHRSSASATCESTGGRAARHARRTWRCTCASCSTFCSSTLACRRAPTSFSMTLITTMSTGRPALAQASHSMTIMSNASKTRPSSSTLPSRM